MLQSSDGHGLRRADYAGELLWVDGGMQCLRLSVDGLLRVAGAVGCCGSWRGVLRAGCDGGLHYAGSRAHCVRLHCGGSVLWVRPVLRQTTLVTRRGNTRRSATL